MHPASVIAPRWYENATGRAPSQAASSVLMRPDRGPGEEGAVMTTAATRADLAAIKARQQKTWASGDFAVVAARVALVSERLADAADLRAGWRVLDVACG